MPNIIFVNYLWVLFPHFCRNLCVSICCQKSNFNALISYFVYASLTSLISIALENETSEI